MDGQGVWHNRHGRFRRKKIIDHFNAAIGHDDGGFYVCQERGDILEKVYFSCEDTAYFAVSVDLKPVPVIVGHDPDGLDGRRCSRRSAFGGGHGASETQGRGDRGEQDRCPERKRLRPR